MKKQFVLLAFLLVGCATDYNRKDWKHWIDEDRDCQNTRAEVLIQESRVPVTFVFDEFPDEKQCVVATGEWYDPYSGEVFTRASDLDIDHFVPLNNAHRSGGWAWSPERKRLYANDMRSKDHLIAVSKRLNRQKGAKGPEEWVPPNPDYLCEYLDRWIEIKMRWGLAFLPGEEEAIRIHWAIDGGCD